jgi:hypothetical protein
VAAEVVIDAIHHRMAPLLAVTVTTLNRLHSGTLTQQHVGIAGAGLDLIAAAGRADRPIDVPTA